MIDIPRAECQHLINRWRKNSKELAGRAEWADDTTHANRLKDMESVYSGCARALEIVLETADTKYAKPKEERPKEERTLPEMWYW